MAEIKPTTDTFGMSEEFIQKQQQKRQQGNLNAPGTVSAEAKVNEVVAPAPVVETPNVSATPSTVAPETSPVAPVAPVQTPVAPSVPATPTTQNQPATPSTVAPPTTVTVKEEKPQLIDNKALQFNKAVDENRKKGMNEQQAYQTAMQKLIRPSVSDLRKSGTNVNTPDGRRAKFENDQFAKYSTMSPTQLFNELKSGNLSPKLQTELQSTPAFAEAKTKFEAFKQIDNINANTGALLGNERIVNPIQTLSDNLTNLFTSKGGTDGVMRFREYISQNPVITQKTSEYNTQAAEKMELERARSNVVKDLKAKYAGLPMSTVLAMASRETEPLNERINTLNDSLTILGAEIKQESDFAVQEFEIYQSEIQAQQAKEQKLQEVLANLAISDYQTNKQQAFEAQKMQASQMYDLQKMEIQNKFETDRDVNNFVQDLQKIGIQNEFELQKALQGQGFQKELLALNQKYENSRSVRDFQNDLTKLGYQFNLQQQSKALDLANEKEIADYKASLDPDLAEKWEAVRAKATENSSLADLYGKNVGTYEGNRGYDLAGKLGDAIVAPPGAKVIAINAVEGDGRVSVFEEGKGAMSKKDPGYGNSVLLQLPDGSKMRLSHLKDISVNLGETLAGGQALGTRGNTGNVLGKNGEKLTPEQLAAGRGAHVDVEIFDPSGKLLSQSQQLEFLKSVKPFSVGKEQTEPLTDKQYTQFNQAIGRFSANPQVKAFEEALSSGGDLIASIKSANGPGDVAAVFQFMKTLDPASVVREGEFALAEASAGLPEKVGNIYEKVMNGERLTDDQRKAFGKIAFKYIENKAKLYDTHYNDMQKVLKGQNIPESYYPTKMSDYIKDFSGEEVTQQQKYDYADAYLKTLGY